MPANATYPKFSDANLQGAFFGAFEDAMAASYLPEIAMFIDSDRAYEDYGWLGALPQMREWKGGRVLNQPNEYDWTIWNKKYENTLQLPIDDIRRDKTGQFDIWAAGLGETAAENPIILLSDLLESGESQVCFDGQFFFDTDHVEGNSGTQSNDISIDISTLPVQIAGTPTAPSDEEMEKVILQMIKQFYKLKDDQGRPVNQTAKKFVIVAPIDYMDPVLAALGNDTMANGRKNTLVAASSRKGFSFIPYFDARLSWTDKLAMFRVDHSVKPFVHQVELDTQFNLITSPDNDHVFKFDEYLWGIKKVEAVGYGDYKKAMLATLV